MQRTNHNATATTATASVTMPPIFDGSQSARPKPPPPQVSGGEEDDDLVTQRVLDILKKMTRSDDGGDSTTVLDHSGAIRSFSFCVCWCVIIDGQ